MIREGAAKLDPRAVKLDFNGSLGHAQASSDCRLGQVVEVAQLHETLLARIQLDKDALQISSGGHDLALVIDIGQGYLLKRDGEEPSSAVCSCGFVSDDLSQPR